MGGDCGRERPRGHRGALSESTLDPEYVQVLVKPSRYHHENGVTLCHEVAIAPKRLDGIKAFLVAQPIDGLQLPRKHSNA
jgi:hypothetical protein